MVQKPLFLSTFRVKNVHVEVGGGQRRAKLCPRSPQQHCNTYEMINLVEEIVFRDKILAEHWTLNTSTKWEKTNEGHVGQIKDQINKGNCRTLISTVKTIL